MTELSKLIKNQREKLGLRQSDIAKKIGVTNQYFSGVERGKVPLATKKISKVSTALKLNKTIMVNAIVEDYKNWLTNQV